MQRNYRKWRSIQTLVELIYPPRCLGCGDLVTSDFGLCGSCWSETAFIGGTVCETCGTPLPGQNWGRWTECDDCMTSPRLWQAGRAALLYHSRARKLVLALKHGDRPELAKPAARWMAHAGRELFRPNMLIAPVPLHWSRLAKRRYNQSALLARHLSKEVGQSDCPDLLIRHTRTPILDGKSAIERQKIMAESIAVNPRHAEKMVGRDILLVDDVMTTGATLAACTQACIASGAEHIFVLVLARVAKDA